MVKILLASLGGLTGWFSIFFFKDAMKNKDSLNNNNSWVKLGILGFVFNFFDTLGIGSFAPLTASMKFLNQVRDRIIPGTLNVSCTIPIVFEAFIFISVIQVEMFTLVAMIGSAVIGAYLGAGIVAKMDETKIQIVMGFALLVTAFLMLSGQMGWMPVGGKAIGLSGMKLGFGVAGNFILGALMTAGVGLYAPCMALIYMLGLSAKVAFPIMMGSCAFLMPVASKKFIDEGAYDIKASIAITLTGIFGVLIAAYLVKELPLKMLTFVVIGVVTITGFSMLNSAFETLKDENAEGKVA